MLWSSPGPISNRQNLPGYAFMPGSAGSRIGAGAGTGCPHGHRWSESRIEGAQRPQLPMIELVVELTNVISDVISNAISIREVWHAKHADFESRQRQIKHCWLQHCNVYCPSVFLFLRCERFSHEGGVSLRAVGLLFISQLGRMGEAKGRRKMWRRMRRRSGNKEGEEEEEEDRDEA